MLCQRPTYSSLTDEMIQAILHGNSRFTHSALTEQHNPMQWSAHSSQYLDFN